MKAGIDMGETNGCGIDGEDFAVFIIVVILFGLFFFGSRDIEGLSAQPTQ